MSKRIIFSTATPNDQGGVIPNNVIDFSRFNKNPVCLNEHRWGEDPIGMWSDIKMEGGKWTGVPLFHGITEASATKKALYEGGWVRAASIGGEAIWEENATGQYKLDKDGNRICKIFYLYEISIVTLPSNEDAVQEDAVALHAKIYETAEIDKITNSLTTLGSKYNLNFNSNTMKLLTKKEFDKLSAPEKTTYVAEMKTFLSEVETSEEDEDEDEEEIRKKAERLAAKKLGAKGDELPGWFKKLIGLGVPVTFGGEPTPKDTPESTQQKKKDIVAPQPTPIGLKAKAVEAAKSEMEACKDAAAKATEKVKEMKAKAEKDDATEEDKAAYTKAKEDADDAMKACEAAEKAHNKAMEAADDEDDDDDEDDEPANKKTKNTARKVRTTNAARKISVPAPELKSTDELKAELKLAVAPSLRVKIGAMANGRTFSQLASATDAESKNLLMSVRASDAQGKSIEAYAAVLSTILNDGKYKAIIDKTRIMMNVNESQIGAYQNNPNQRSGISLQQLSAELSRGEVEMMGRDNVMRKITTLNSTDNALASPALTTIEWLSLAIFKLFPNSSWKNEIPMFGAEMTGRNTGIIWANVAADPTIYKGTQPATPANYTYGDTPVSLALTPYWLQPMLWTPLTMHQLRYDQMGTGWAQAFAKWNAVIDDNLIYTLASTVPAGSIINTTGLSGVATQPGTFNITGPTDPNSFYWSPAFTGSLVKPSLNDIISVEQLYNKQNFMLETERPTLITDPTMQAYLDKDPETKSLLTRWVNQDGGEFPKFKNTIMAQRSRVAIYNPTTGLVLDPNGSIPSNAISAALGFIPSQIGMGLGMLDVFMIQDPTSYGYKMSADIRVGIAPLRADFTGTSILTYGSVPAPAGT